MRPRAVWSWWTRAPLLGAAGPQRRRGVACGSPRGHREGNSWGGSEGWWERWRPGEPPSRKLCWVRRPDLLGPPRGCGRGGDRAPGRPLRTPPRLVLQNHPGTLPLPALGPPDALPPPCAVLADVGSYLRAPGGPRRPGRRERPPARVPAVPRAVRTPLPARLLPPLLRRLPARPRQRRPLSLPAVPVSARKPSRSPPRARSLAPPGQGPWCREGKAPTPSADWERPRPAGTSALGNARAPAHSPGQVH